MVGVHADGRCGSGRPRVGLDESAVALGLVRALLVEVRVQVEDDIAIRRIRHRARNVCAGTMWRALRRAGLGVTMLLLFHAFTVGIEIGRVIQKGRHGGLDTDLTGCQGRGRTVRRAFLEGE